MKRKLALGLCIALIAGMAPAQVLAAESENTEINAAIAAQKVDKSTQPRVLVTTDLEVDDMNGILLSLMYADQYDLAGIVWTAGQFHFSGDGEHTLKEITPNYKCEVEHAENTVENAGELKEFRPVDPTWLTRVIDVYYRADYEKLSQNNPNYPDPDYLLSIAKRGNVEFEGDYRFETDGSKLIMDCILDDDPRPLYIQHWGGINTTVRALMSIYEQYHDTDEWEEVLEKVVEKVRIFGNGEDNCRADSKIDELFPGLKANDRTGFSSYGQYFSAIKLGEGPLPFMGSSERLLPYYQGEYLTEAFKFGHGQLLSNFHLMGDGQVIWGEPDCYQYGLQCYIDWSELAALGYGKGAEAFTRTDYDPYDWMCLQFGCSSFVDIGLRQGLKNEDDRYVEVMFDELAARADWAICDPAECNHAPVVSAENTDITAKAGETVELSGSAIDPDGTPLTASWWIPANASSYQDGAAENLTVSQKSGWETAFTVPEDAKSGQSFVINLEVTDTEAERPMTRFAQFIVTVE